MHGWDLGCPCEVRMYSPAYGQEGYNGDPTVELSAEKGFNFTAVAALDFSCKKNKKNDTEYS